MADETGDVDDLKSANAKELHRAIREEGEEELRRPLASLFWSGIAAGVAINTSLLTEGVLHQHLPDTPWRELVTALGYPIGFLIVILGRMQLFTESTITAVLPLVSDPTRESLLRTLRLWGVVLSANMIGTAIGAATIAFGGLGSAGAHDAMIAVSLPILDHAPFATLINAVPAGFLIAILAWTLPNAREQSFLVIFAVTWVVAICGFSHSVVGSCEAFLLFFSGHADGLRTVFGLILPAIVGNLIGGAGIFALLAHGQVRGEMTKEALKQRKEERRQRRLDRRGAKSDQHG
ncbi:formate/nitrite transporter family protein [Sphingomonas sp. BAUL-RG-20F-R05-02]|uniref:formate/nitrite transporter family protein n=1 Tax=Sphingomonas sp. BAUL-RG-20F-R05-02 TaxID=2914830 RepID=UPI001F568898|nr:formate/nitrite transporter family protein [Sphingomonas sp. BAUL-RG-20F-R05-02]